MPGFFKVIMSMNMHANWLLKLSSPAQRAFFKRLFTPANPGQRLFTPANPRSPKFGPMGDANVTLGLSLFTT